MDDQRDHYGDPVPAWATNPPPDPTGLRPCDRAHLAGWIGVFIALILLGIAIGYGGVLRGRPATGDLAFLGWMGATIIGYGFAGIYLIARTLTDRPPTGALVVICNVMVVGPFLVPGTLIVLALLPGMVAGSLTAIPAFQALGVFFAFFGFFGFLLLLALWYTGDGRRLLQLLRAWLDPTGGQWW